MLLILGMLGAWVLVRREGPWALVPLLPLFLGAVACTTLYHPSTRYRLAMIVPLLILSGPGVCVLRQERRERGRGLLSAPALAVWWQPASEANCLSRGLSGYRRAGILIVERVAWVPEHFRWYWRGLLAIQRSAKVDTR